MKRLETLYDQATVDRNGGHSPECEGSCHPYCPLYTVDVFVGAACEVHGGFHVCAFAGRIDRVRVNGDLGPLVWVDAATGELLGLVPPAGR